MVRLEFIKAEEFLKQSKEVQKVFLDWWQPSYFDLLHCDCGTTFNGHYDGEENISYYDFNTKQREWISKYKAIPLFTEGQLRQFIEDKTDSKLETMYLNTGYSIRLIKNNPEIPNKIYSKHFLGTDLFQAYWKVAVEVAKGEKQCKGWWF